MPRIAGRQMNRGNASAAAVCDCQEDLAPCIHKVEDYYRVNFAVPFVDHILSELNLQFTGKLHRCFLCL